MPSLGGKVIVDYGIAEIDAGTYLVGLYVLPEEYEVLHEAVFVPAVEALAPIE